MTNFLTDNQIELANIGISNGYDNIEDAYHNKDKDLKDDQYQPWLIFMGFLEKIKDPNDHRKMITKLDLANRYMKDTIDLNPYDPRSEQRLTDLMDNYNSQQKNVETPRATTNTSADLSNAGFKKRKKKSTKKLKRNMKLKKPNKKSKKKKHKN
tara:strand:+ start:276 stop:737 length:462 start_codon:yes stop_codon:yes gene_type:complete